MLNSVLGAQANQQSLCHVTKFSMLVERFGEPTKDNNYNWKNDIE